MPDTLTLAAEQKIYYALRIAVAMCFIGHGAFGIITKAVWLNYFGVFGINEGLAYQLMPPLGIFDIVLGLIMLVWPVRAIVVWLVVWGVLTALLRPMAGEPVAELVERAGNYGAPLALLMLTGYRLGSFKHLFTPIGPPAISDEKALKQVKILLRVVVFMLLAGHGWLNLIEKKGLLDQYASIGFSEPAVIARIVGVFEIGAGLAVLVRPAGPLLLFLFLWKMVSELFYPHYFWFEWIERGGSYGCILALWFAVQAPLFSKREVLSDPIKI